MIYGIVEGVAVVLFIGAVLFAAYAWLEFRHNARRTSELARHVRKHYEERDGVIEPRRDVL